MIRARWTGTALEPCNGYSRRVCKDRLQIGEIVGLEVERDRSEKSHKAQFAEIRRAWLNMPESMSEAPYAKSPDALRKHALCATGYCHIETIDCGSDEAAERVASSMRRDGFKAWGYCVVVLRGPLVTRYTPRSQSVQAMGAAEFEESKERALTYIAQLLDVSRSDLKNGVSA